MELVVVIEVCVDDIVAMDTVTTLVSLKTVTNQDRNWKHRIKANVSIQNVVAYSINSGHIQQMSLLDSTLSKKKSDALFVNINDLGILWKL